MFGKIRAQFKFPEKRSFENRRVSLHFSSCFSQTRRQFFRPFAPPGRRSPVMLCSSPLVFTANLSTDFLSHLENAPASSPCVAEQLQSPSSSPVHRPTVPMLNALCTAPFPQSLL